MNFECDFSTLVAASIRRRRAVLRITARVHAFVSIAACQTTIRELPLATDGGDNVMQGLPFLDTCISCQGFSIKHGVWMQPQLTWAASRRFSSIEVACAFVRIKTAYPDS